MVWLLLLQTDLDAREAARLADAGDADALRAHAGSFWAQAALDEIAARRALGELWPVPKRFSFSWNEYPFEEAAQEVAEAIGVDISTVRDEGTWDPVTLELKDVTAAEAVAALATAGGAVPSGGAESWTFGTGWDEITANTAWGNALFSITGLYRQRRVSFTDPSESTMSIYLQLSGAPGLYGCCSSRAKVIIVEALDNTGRSLVRPPPPVAESHDDDYSDPDVGPAEEFGEACETHWPYLTFFLDDPGNVEKIARLRGTVDLARAGRRTSTVLKDVRAKPEGAVGELKLSFDDPTTEYGQVILRLRVARADGGGFGGNVPHLHFGLRRGDEETTTESAYTQARWDGDRAVVFHIYLYSTDNEASFPDAVEVSLIEEETPFRVSFEFADIEVGP